MGMDFDSDSLLVQKMRMGDDKALESFVKKYYPQILKYCQIHINDYGYAEDMTQETFARFFRTLYQYRHCGKAANYLYSIAANVCRDYYKKQKEIPFHTLPEPAGREAEPLDRLVGIRNVLESLPDEWKEVSVLYFIQERKQKDIAKILGISLPLVKYRIRKAREQFIAYFGKEDL